MVARDRFDSLVWSPDLPGRLVAAAHPTSSAPKAACTVINLSPAGALQHLRAQAPAGLPLLGHWRDYHGRAGTLLQLGNVPLREGYLVWSKCRACAQTVALDVACCTPHLQPPRNARCVSTCLILCVQTAAMLEEQQLLRAAREALGAKQVIRVATTCHPASILALEQFSTCLWAAAAVLGDAPLAAHSCS